MTYPVVLQGGGVAISASGGVIVNAPPTVSGYDGSLAVNSSGQLTNGGGVVIQIRGTNASGLNDQTIIPTSFNQYSPYGNGNGSMPSDPNFIWFASQKYNAVRFPINVQAFLGRSYEFLTGSTNATAGWGGTSYAADIYGLYKYYLLRSIQECRRNGLYVIVDAHECAPQFTLGGVTASLAAIDQSPFMDAYSCSTYWGDTSLSMPAWLATNFGSAAFNAANGFNGGAAGAYYDSTKGGASGFNDVIFEIFNEPYFGNQNSVLSLTCIAGTHGNAAWKATNGGNAITVTSGQTPPSAPGASSLGATLAGEHFVMLYGGTCSAFYQQGVYSNSRGIPTGFVNSGNTGLASVLNQSWTVYGYQQALTAIRALGATNVCLVNGSGFASSQSILPYYMPVDTMSPPQIGTGWHQYESGSSGYPVTLDPGSGTSTAMNYGIKNANGSSGLGYAVPVIITEIATTSGTSNTQPDPYYTYVLGVLDANGIGITDFAGNNPAAVGASGPVQYCESIYGSPITVTGSIAAGTLEATFNVTSTSQTIVPGMAITSGGQGGYGSPYVMAYGTNGTTGTGGNGTYALSFNQTVSAGTSIQLSSLLAFRGQGQTYTNWTLNHA
jgi:hypothetical protein